MNEEYTEESLPYVADKILEIIAPLADAATIVALTGDLGAGKTTLTKTIAALLGVEDTVVSPTFVVAKFYVPTKGLFTHFVHIDAYRIESLDELVPLGFEKIIAQPTTLVVIEWPERIGAALPASTNWFTITHTSTGRHIEQKK